MLSALDVVTDLVMIAAAAIYGYVAYSAFAISRTLSNGIYRRQAMGVAVVAIVILILGEGTGFNSASGPVSTVDFIAGFLSFYATFIGLYYWIDASIGAARLTDPLYRDTFHWTRLRLAFWAYDAVALVFFLAAGILGVFDFTTAPPIVLVFVLIPLAIMIFGGAVVLPIAARRSKDRLMKKHLNWFAVYVIVVLGFVFVVGGTPLQSLLVAAAGGYFLYRCVRSLVPLYKFKTVSKDADKAPQRAP
ncbi:MAG: hypothetical protein OK456_07945 [Thaumarchaeota archaeon]|nr:hypothetical protein [Nitrososphaerota archaeon]